MKTANDYYAEYLLLSTERQNYIVNDYLNDWDNDTTFDKFLKYNLKRLLTEYNK